MLVLEWLLIASLALRAGAALVPRTGPGRRVRTGAALAVAVATGLLVAVAGVRWQLLPAALVAGVVVALDLAAAGRSSGPRGSVRGRAGRAIAGFVAVSLLAAPGWVLPVPRLPAPTGPHAVGTDTFEFAVPVAEAAIEALPGGEARDGTAQRAPMPLRARARVWYPAASGPATDAAPRAPWLEHARTMTPALARGAGLPEWVLGHLRRIEPHAKWRAPVAGDAPLPVVTFDHGRRGWAAQNSFLTEELASYGFVVVAAEHPGGAMRSVLRDGTIVDFDPGAFGAGRDGPAFDAAIRALGREWAGTTQAAVRAANRGEGPAALAGRLDLDRWFATGHSTGGGAAFEVCRREAGCRGVVGLDPWMLPAPEAFVSEPPRATLDADVLALFSDPALGFFEPANRAAFDRLAAASRAAGRSAAAVVIEGAGHSDLTDIGLLSPLAPRLEIYVGPRPPGEVHPEVRRRVLAWMRLRS